MGALDFSIDTSAFSASIKSFIDATDVGRMAAALAVGHEIMRLSQFEVPHDTGYLQNSGAVEQLDGDVIVGYHAPQAARLHEHPEYRFQKGRKGKYLTDPITRNQGSLGLVFGNKFEENIK